MVEITVLCENTTFDHRLIAEHGWSVHIRHDDLNYLFDCGTGKSIAGNAEALGFDLSKVHGIMLSHGHYDHTLGISSILESVGDCVFYAHPSTFECKYALHEPDVISIGCDQLMEILDKENLNVSTEVQKVAPGMFLSGEIPRRFHQSSDIYYCDEECTIQDMILDDQFLVLDLPDGLVIVLGCCHSGIRNSMDRARNLFPNKRIKLVLGGMHLKGEDPIAINDAVEVFREYGPERIGMAHCSGIDSYAAIREQFDGNMFWASTGTRLVL